MNAPMMPTMMFPIKSETVALDDGTGEPAGDGTDD